MRQKNPCRLLYGLISAVLCLLSACSEMNDVHKMYLQRGETLYVGRPDSVAIFAGRERVKLRYWLSDMKAAKMAVYWMSHTDSVVLDVPAHSAKDPIDVIIPNLPEYNHTFSLVTMNKDFRNRSVVLQTTGHAYGSLFQSSLLDRFVRSAMISAEKQLEIKWHGSVQKAVGCEVEYADPDGITRTLFVPVTESTTLIDNVQGSVSYRTLFLPEQTAIDTFYTAYRPVPL